MRFQLFILLQLVVFPIKLLGEAISVVDTACQGTSTMTLQVHTAEYKTVQWYDENGAEIGDKAEVGVPVVENAKYTARCVVDTIYEDLLENGDFEKGYVNFTSDFTTATDADGNPVLDPTDFANTYFEGKYGEYYAIVADASHFWSGNYAIQPVSGKYYTLFDVTNNGYAWRVTTDDNPRLKVIKDEVYTFSFWVNTPNQGTELDKPCPKLVVEIVAYDENGQGNSSKLSADAVEVRKFNDYEWRYYYFEWPSTTTSDNVKIHIQNTESSREGNDFCLDDIRFTHISEIVQVEEIHTIVTKDCNSEQDECLEGFVYAKWDNVLFVDKGEKGRMVLGDVPVAYQWYKDDEPIVGETEQVFYAPQTKLGEGLFYVVVTFANGTKIKSCPHSFFDTERSVESGTVGLYLIPSDAYSIETNIYYIGNQLKIIRWKDSQGRRQVKKYFIR